MTQNCRARPFCAGLHASFLAQRRTTGNFHRWPFGRRWGIAVLIRSSSLFQLYLCKEEINSPPALPWKLVVTCGNCFFTTAVFPGKIVYGNNGEMISCPTLSFSIQDSFGVIFFRIRYYVSGSTSLSSSIVLSGASGIFCCNKKDIV